jgi:hypothetical protein
MFFTAFAGIFFCGRKICESFKDFERISRVLCSLLQSLTDLSDFRDALNASSFCNYLSRI